VVFSLARDFRKARSSTQGGKEVAWVFVGVVLRPNVEAAARDHLANERTFLAWFRTGAAVAGLGLATPRLAGETSAGAWLAAALVAAFGVVILAYGVFRFRRSTAALELGCVSVDTRGPLVLVLTAVAVGGACICLLLF
jgi:putative membrane protein